jgi:Calcineurin-like phosphoesterase
VLYWKKFAARGQGLEREVTQLKMMSKYRPKERGLQSATNATYALYICTAAFWLFSLFWWAVGPAPSKAIRILVAGDGRAQYPWVERRQEDVDGINKTIAQEIERAVLAEKAQMLLWTGDLSNVNSRDNGVFKTQLLAWRQIMEPLYQKGVIVLPIRGNHEVLRYIKDESTNGESIPDASRIWNEVFTGRYALPPNGPDGEKNLTFYYVYRSVLAIGLDDFETAKNAVDVNWLKSVLSTNKRPFIFAFGHEQAFASGSHPETETLAANKPTRDQMWEALITAGARAYFCGHDHFYDHMSVFRNHGNPGPEMHQLVAGTAGAPFYARGDYPPDDNWKRTIVRHIDNAYGYILIVIDGDTATITFKGQIAPGRYSAMDSFAYTVVGL